jgi:hypothetical protein
MAKKSALSQYLASIGRKGGQKKGVKGIAALPPERQEEIRAKAAEARRKQAKKKGK